ncbi:hypothetical protein RISK_002373 [Rhodopirellula islandica]|uniref:Transmembrane protein n=1 Tax=Rhodopirellula islandica TaxID=595434 RepID=A0A0J1BGU4_RHOIS|nr:hypothetical protein [Rhodopirellula islandica]KLU05741.1 hypothetical protein RISK_002373 [Rhodopirellula islandica]
MNNEEVRRGGYTILELMLSLILLAALMMVAWSILGSYRDAEQRGWNQAYQMQVIRIARDWLDSDAASLMEPRVSMSPSSTPTPSFSSHPTQLRPFQGNELGFEVDLIPSFDPLPWLEAVTQAEAPLSTTTQARSRENSSTSIALDPLTIHHLRYTIVPRDVISGAGPTDSAEELFDVQRELVPVDRWSKASASSSEKELTMADLYRVPDEERPIESAADGATLATSIRNLVAPRFRYSDGAQWLGQWDSQLKGGLPRAIELSFDLPSASTSYETVVPEEDEADEFVAEDFADMVMSSEPVATIDESSSSGEDDALIRDVRIVVFIAGSRLPGSLLGDPHE